MGILSELSQRRFLQITGGFVAAGWIAMEAADQLVGHDMLPEIWYRILWLWYIAGILGSVILGWYHGSKGRQAFTAPELSMLAVIVVVFGGLSIRTYRAAGAAPAPATVAGDLDLSTIAIPYFQFIGEDTARAVIADGMTEALIQELSTVRGLTVISANGVRPFRDSGVPADSIARALEAGTVVEGTIEDRGDQIRVSLALVDGSSGAEFRRLGLEQPFDEILAMQDALAWDLSLYLREWLGREVELRMLGRGTESPQAWASLLRGRRAMEQGQELRMIGQDGAADEAYADAQRLFENAAALDPEWPEPHVSLSSLAYRRSREAESLEEAEAFIDEGLDAAAAALSLNPRQPEALEYRGTITYWMWLIQLTSDPEARQAEFDSARHDLEECVSLDPSRASAYSTLSHLYYNDDVASAVLAARRAYEEDAYLSVANEVLWRLFNGSLDLTQFGQAERWCREGYARFPDDYRFSLCELQLMATPALDPDVNRGWALVDRIESLLPEAWLGYQRAEDRLFQGGVIARAGLGDSARAVLESARNDVTPDDDPGQELLSVEAAMWVVADDHDRAIELLRRYVAANPGHEFGRGGDLGWWWQDLRDHPGFASLRGR